MSTKTLIPVSMSATTGDGDAITPRVRVLRERHRATKTGQARPPKTGAVVTMTCISMSTEDLEMVDAAALRAGLNRSAYLTACALACADKPRADIEVGAWAQRAKRKR